MSLSTCQPPHASCKSPAAALQHQSLASTSVQQEPQGPCFFFRLPPELRNTVYELVLADAPLKGKFRSPVKLKEVPKPEEYTRVVLFGGETKDRALQATQRMWQGYRNAEDDCRELHDLLTQGNRRPLGGQAMFRVRRAPQKHETKTQQPGGVKKYHHPLLLVNRQIRVEYGGLLSGRVEVTFAINSINYLESPIHSASSFLLSHLSKLNISLDLTDIPQWQVTQLTTSIQRFVLRAEKLTHVSVTSRGCPKKSMVNCDCPHHCDFQTSGFLAAVGRMPALQTCVLQRRMTRWHYRKEAVGGLLMPVEFECEA